VQSHLSEKWRAESGKTKTKNSGLYPSFVALYLYDHLSCA
jgi:hypothetical protein